MGKGWIREPEQEMFLKQKLPEFSDAQRKKRVARFFGNVFEGWFKKYPERDLLFGADRDLDTLTDNEKETLTEAIFQRKEQLRTYFYWHAPSRHPRSDGQINFSWLVELLTGKRAKGAPRQKKLLDVYSKMFYETKLRGELDKRMKAAYPGEFSAEKKSDKYHSRRFSLLHRLKKEMWEKESEEVRQLVEKERKKLAQTNEVDDERLHKPNDLDLIKGIETETKNLPAVLDKIAKAVMERTGFATTILMGGIRHDGILSGTVIHSGKTAEGNLTFQDTMIDFEESVLEPWGHFLERVYPLSKRKAQAEFYSNVYKVSNAGNESESGLVCTRVWDSEDNEKEDEEGEGRCVPDKESSSSSEIPNEETPSMSTTPSTISTPQNTQTTGTPDIHAHTAPTTSMSVPMAIEAPTTAGSISHLQPGPSADYNNTSGLCLPSPGENSWEQPSGFTSVSDEFNFAMASVDLGFSPGLSDQFTLDSHAALLQQNSMPNGGVDMAYSDNMGMSGQDWQWLSMPQRINPSTASVNNYSGAFPSVNPVTFQTILDPNPPTFSIATAMSSASSHTWSPPSSSGNNGTSNILNQPGVPTPSPPAKDGAGSSPSTGPPFTSTVGNSVSNSLPGEGLTAFECPSNPNPVHACTDAPDNEEASKEPGHQDAPQLPLQEIPANTSRRQSGRPRKRKLHRDAEFEREQEAREVKRKKEKGDVQARKHHKTR